METVKQPSYARRVHIAPVGFEIDRVVEPLIRMEADKVYLFAEKTENAEKLQHFIDEIIKRLEKESIKYEQRGWELPKIELYTTLREYRRIIDEEKDNNIFINVSTGSKIHAIAGMISSMIFKQDELEIMPYYVIPEKYAESPSANEQYTTGCKEIKTLPNYHIEKPPNEIMEVLAIIAKIKEKVITKKILIEALEEDHIPLTATADKNSKNDAGKYNALRRKYLEPLEKWKYIKIDDKSKRPRIEITEEGRNALMFLRD